MSAHGDYKIFNDPVHGTIKLGPLLVRIIDTPEFQRLRHIKQLSGAYFVYPGAQHNRFEHSIGTAHLAGKLIRHLKETQPDLGINSQDIQCVEIAGLCHDLGHGPFSHLFDGGFLPRCEVKREHEKVSCDMFDRIMDSMPPQYQLSDIDRTCIKEMIDGPSDGGKQYQGRGSEKGFLFEIISNKKSGVDVDKWDYFARDCHHLRIANGFDHNRFIEFTRVIKDENEWRICVRDKEVFNLYEMFHTRFALHKRAYQHKAVNAIEHMICDALVEANSVIQIRGDGNRRNKMSECVIEQNLGSFCNLDDRVLQTIEHSEENDLEPARKILKRLSTGDHYRCIGSKIFRRSFRKEERNRLEKEIQGKIEELLSKASSFTGTIKASIITFNYGKKHEDPIKYCLFYSKTNPDVAKKIKRDDVSTLLPSVFQEFWIQVFCTKENLSKEELQNAEEAFENWYQNHTE